MARNGTSMTALMLATLALAPAAGLAQPAGPAFRVNNFTTGSQRQASVASNPAGGFVVAWSSVGQDSPESRIFCRRYAISGEPIGGEFRVNSLTTLSQYDASVAVGPSGGFVVVWDGDFGDPFSSIVG